MRRSFAIGGLRTTRACLLAVIGCAMMLPCIGAQATDLVRNRGQPEYLLYADDGVARAGTVPATLPSAHWSAIPVSGDGYFFLYNKALPGGVLHLERDALAVGSADPMSDHAMWQLRPAGDGFYFICNRVRPDRCLYFEDGRLEAGSVEPDWRSAMWSVPTLAPAAANGGGTKNGNGPTTTPPTSPPPTTAPPPVAAPPVVRPAQALPDFPWPPPPATRLVLPRPAIVGRPGVASQADVADVLVEALAVNRRPRRADGPRATCLPNSASPRSSCAPPEFRPGASGCWCSS